MSLRTFAGVGCIGIGLLFGAAMVAAFPGALVGGCTDVGVPDDHDRRVAIEGVEDGDLVYTPDGRNECRLPLPYVLAPIASIGVGAVLVWLP